MTRFGVLRRRWLLAAVAVAVLGVWDLNRSPARQLSNRVLITAIQCHQITVARGLAALGVECRFVPTCSRYAADVLGRRGVVAGSWLTLRRLVRCGPWTAEGTVDPPPAGPAMP